MLARDSADCKFPSLSEGGSSHGTPNVKIVTMTTSAKKMNRRRRIGVLADGVKGAIERCSEAAVEVC